MKEPYNLEYSVLTSTTVPVNNYYPQTYLQILHKLLGYYKLKKLKENLKKLEKNTDLKNLFNFKKNIIIRTMPITSPSILNRNIDIESFFNIFLTFIIPLFYLPFVIKNNYQLLLEKEKKLKEVLLRSGVSIYSYNFSFLLSMVIEEFIPLLAISFFLKYTYFPNTSVFLIFLPNLIFLINLITLSIFVTNIFSSIKTGQTCIKISFVCLCLFSVLISRLETKFYVKLIFHFIPFVPYNGILLDFIDCRHFKQGISYSDLFKYRSGKTYGINIFVMILNSFVSYFLSIFLNKLINSNFNLLYTLKIIKKKQFEEYVNRNKISLEDNNMNEDYFEKLNIINIEKDRKRNKSLLIKNLCATIGEKKDSFSINNFTLELFNSEIFVILGENGAGKSTLFNAICNQIKSDYGEIKYLGYDLLKDKNLLNKLLSLDNQENVLFDHLTVEEHFDLINNIKYVPKEKKYSKITKAQAYSSFATKNNNSVYDKNELKSIILDNNVLAKNNNNTDNKRELSTQFIEQTNKINSKKINKIQKFKEEVFKLINCLDLNTKLKQKASSLTEGERRKLSVALTILGDSKLIILDEPTSGVDISSKRELWTFLKLHKKNKIVIVSTHSLDEAEFLADRIGIIKDGSLICCGSSSFLKEKFSCGFKINILFKECSSLNEKKKIYKKIKKLYPDIINSTTTKDMLTLYFNNKNNIVDKIYRNNMKFYSLNNKTEYDTPSTIRNSLISKSNIIQNKKTNNNNDNCNLLLESNSIYNENNFKKLFLFIENLKDSNILDYSVSTTTLEDVFMKIHLPKDNKDIVRISSNMSSNTNNYKILDNCNINLNTLSNSLNNNILDKNNRNSIDLRDFNYLSDYNNANHISKNFAKGYIIDLENERSEKDADLLSIKSSNKEIELTNKKKKKYNKINDLSNKFCSDYYKYFKRNIKSLTRRKKLTVMELFGCILLIFFFVYFTKGYNNYNIEINPIKLIELSDCIPYYQNIDYTNDNNNNNKLLDTKLFFGINYNKINNLNEEVTLNNYIEFDQYIFDLTQEHNTKTGIYISNNQDDIIDIYALYSASSIDLSIGLQEFLLQSFINRYLNLLNIYNNQSLQDKRLLSKISKKNKDISKEAIYHIYRGLDSGYTRKKGAQFFIQLIAYFLIAISILIYAGFNLHIIIEDRVSKNKNLIYLSGGSKFLYWFSLFTSDIIKFSLLIFINIILGIFIWDDLIIFKIIVLIFLYSAATIVITYVFSSLVNKEHTGQNVLISYFILNLIVSLCANAVVFPSAAFITNKWLISYTALSPLSEFLLAGIKLSTDYLLNHHNQNTILLNAIIIIIAHIAIFSIILILIELGYFDKLKRFWLIKVKKPFDTINFNKYISYQKTKIEDTSIIENSTTKNNKEEINQLTNSIRLINLNKVYYNFNSYLSNCFNYKKICALNRLNLYLEKNEKLGLLGANGSGKSSILKSLANEITLDSGEVKVYNKNLYKNFEEIRHMIGYCPQKNTLFERLTVKEHIEFYLSNSNINEYNTNNKISEMKYFSRNSLKKLKKNNKNNLLNVKINSILEEFNLKKFKNKRIMDLSSGTKRKLNFAISLINRKNLIILDEPFTGVDPMSRYRIWNKINKVSSYNNSYNIILATHSIEEAEVLCDTIGWLRNGNILIYGTPEKLKLEFTNGYEINFRVNYSYIFTNKNSRKSSMSKSIDELEDLEEFDKNDGNKCSKSTNYLNQLNDKVSLKNSNKYNDLVNEIFNNVYVDKYTNNEFNIEGLEENVMNNYMLDIREKNIIIYAIRTIFNSIKDLVKKVVLINVSYNQVKLKVNFSMSNKPHLLSHLLSISVRIIIIF